MMTGAKVKKSIVLLYKDFLVLNTFDSTSLFEYSFYVIITSYEIR